MSSSVFFVTGRLAQDVTIDEDIAEMRRVIQGYTKQAALYLQRIENYMTPELVNSNMDMVKIFNNGAEAHKKRLSTLEKIKNNNMVLQSELDLLTMMPVFTKYETYSNILEDRGTPLFLR